MPTTKHLFLFHPIKRALLLSDMQRNVMIYVSHILISLFVHSSNCKTGNGDADKRDGVSAGGQGAPECERHIYKSVLEGGDIPLQGLRALNKRHPSTSSKGRIPLYIRI